MGKPITWVALDTSKKLHVGAVLKGNEQGPEKLRLPNESGAIRRFARKLVRSAPERCGYATKQDRAGMR